MQHARREFVKGDRSRHWPWDDTSTPIPIDATLNIDKVRTGGLGGKATTAEFTLALVSRIANGW